MNFIRNIILSFLALSQLSFMDTQFNSIAKAAEDLLYMSETDAPLEPVELKSLNKEDLLHELKVISGKSSASIETQTIDYFFRNQIKEYPGDSEERRSQIRKFETLIRELKQNLSDIHVYRLGTIQIDAYIIGKMKNGKFAGLKTKIVET